MMKLDQETQDALIELLKKAGVQETTIEMVQKDLGLESESPEEEKTDVPGEDTKETPTKEVSVTEVTVSPGQKLMDNLKKLK